ncbi:hypothetical protein KM043_000983 [Ampulex compressa]|nr:hypothetical protein KM043_000983 [Ampulex compressa]
MNVTLGKAGVLIFRRRPPSATLLPRPSFSDCAFVPKCSSANTEDLLRLSAFLGNSEKTCVVTGAGVSTESGIPDYRSTGVGLYAKSKRRPVLYQEFCKSESVRRRYWARNYVGWPRFSSREPNDVHRLLKALEDAGKLSCVITQNVDNLHKKAGSERVIELHGTAFRVVCLNCNDRMCRFEFQSILERLNPSITLTSTMVRPDGDVDLSQDEVDEFIFPPCRHCGGILKPDVVFFGDNVHRIVLQASAAKIPVAIVSIGETRADELADIKIEARCGDILPKAWLPMTQG